MCFSASASFAVSSVLLVGGIAAVSKARKSSMVPFAAIPLLFSAQQFCEGFIWLSLKDPMYAAWNEAATNFFLVFAEVLWPAWVPLSIWLLETDERRKKILSVLVLIGVTASVYLAYCLANYQVTSAVADYHIKYDLDFPNYLMRFSSLFYIVPTVVPMFVSSVKRMFLLGSFNLISFLISRFYFGEYVISIWCFFAAAISIVILYIVNNQKFQPVSIEVN